MEANGKCGRDGNFVDEKGHDASKQGKKGVFSVTEKGLLENPCYKGNF